MAGQGRGRSNGRGKGCGKSRGRGNTRQAGLHDKPKENAAGGDDARPAKAARVAKGNEASGEEQNSPEKEPQGPLAAPKSKAKRAAPKVAEPEGKAKAEPNGEAKAEPKGKAKAEPKGKAKAQPKGKAKAEPKGKAKAKAEPKAKSLPDAKGRKRSANEGEAPEGKRGKQALVEEGGDGDGHPSKTFARRFRPTTESGQLKWDTLRCVFQETIRPRLSGRFSFHEDGLGFTVHHRVVCHEIS